MLATLGLLMAEQRSRRVRVMRIIARLNVGGPAQHVVWLTTGLNDDRFESLLVTGRLPPGEQDMSYLAQAAGVKPIVIGAMTRALSWRDVLVIMKLFVLMWRFRPDVIHTHTAKAGTTGRIAGQLYRWTSWRPVLTAHTFHGHVFHSYYGKVATRLFLFVERFLAWFTDAIVVLSPRQLDEINGRFGVGRTGQFSVIPLGIDLKPFEHPQGDLRAELGLPPETFVAGIVGRLTEVKDHAFFLEAVAQWNGKGTFLVVGDGNLRAMLESRARELRLDDRVVFLGNRTDPEDCYRAFDVAVLTSKNEGTPLTIIEAMASGVPTLSTSVGGVPDLMGGVEFEREGVIVCERGVLIEPGDTAAFGRALTLLAGDRSLRRRLGERGQAFAREHCSKERLVRDIRALYERLASLDPTDEPRHT